MCVDIIYDFFNVIWVKPYDFRVLFEPCELLAHISAGVGLDATDCFGAVGESIKIIKHLPITYCVERIESFEGITAASFVLQTGIHHVKNTLVDTFIEFSAVAVKTNLEDTERTFLLAVGTKGCVGLQQAQEDLRFQVWLSSSGA